MFRYERKGKKLIIDIAYLLIIIAIIYACYGLFTNMSVNTDGNFKSDLPYYIKRATEDPIRLNRLPYVLFRGLYNLTGDCVAICFFLAVEIGMIIIANLAFIKSYSNIDLNNSSARIIAYATSIACIFAGPIYVPGLQTRFYRKLLPIFAWHSPTQQIMTLCAVVGMIFFFKMFDDYENRIHPKWWISTAFMFLLSAYAKPSFIIDLAPTVLIVFIVELLCKTHLDTWEKFKRLFVIGLSVFPAGIYILCLRYIIYISSDRAGDGEVLLTNSGFSDIKHLAFAALFSWLFPLVVTAFNYKRLISERKFMFSATLCLMGLLQAELLAESGRRANHGNFEWGKIIGAYMLTLTCISIAIDNYKNPNYLGNNKYLRVGYFVLVTAALLLQVASQGYYFYTMCHGSGYWR